MRTLLILLLLSTVAIASDTKSGFDPAAIEAEIASPFQETPDTPKAFPELPPSPVPVEKDETVALLQKLVDKYDSISSKMSEKKVPEAEWTKTKEYLTLEERVSKLEREQMTEAKVRVIAQDEIQKALVKLRLPNGTTKEMSVPVNQSGFHLNPGETLIAIDGVPVQNMAPVRDPATYEFQAYSGVSGSYQLQAAPVSNGYNVRIAAPPRARFFRGAQTCVNGRCG
jgi:hypothetical protein